MTHLISPLRVTPRRTAPERLLRASWPGTRVLKSALASGLAWWIATRFGDPVPMFAVFGALNGVQPTISGSLRLTGGALLGIVLGSVLAVISETFVDAPRSVVVALLVALGLLTALRLNAYALLGAEVAVTGLLVFALSQGNILWALGRFGETALGGGIAILINALILPPDYREDARRAADLLVQELKLHMRTALEDACETPSRAEALDHLRAVRTASRFAFELVAQVGRAREALRFSPVLRYSPFRRTSYAEIERYVSGVETLAESLAHVRSAARAAVRLSTSDPRSPPPPPSGDWQALIAATQQAVADFGSFILEGDPATRARADASLVCAMQTLAQVVATSSTGDIARAAVLADTEHVLDELHQALEATEPAG